MTDERPRDDSAGDGAASAPAPDDVVFVRGVSRVFDDRTVVDDIDLVVKRGTIVGVIGPSGAGKTTTIRMITGALVPSTGESAFSASGPTHFRRSTRERIGYMPQLFTLYPDLTARENVDFVASMFGLLWLRRRRRTKDVLKLLDLWDARDQRASRLSGGMQRRLELACALVHDPSFLVPRRADGRHRSPPPGNDLVRAAPASRRWADAPHHDPIRRTRPRSATRSRSSPTDASLPLRRLTSCVAKRTADTRSRSRPRACSTGPFSRAVPGVLAVEQVGPASAAASRRGCRDGDADGRRRHPSGRRRGGRGTRDPPELRPGLRGAGRAGRRRRPPRPTAPRMSAEAAA